MDLGAPADTKQKLRAAFGAWRRPVAYRRVMNESDDDSDMPSLVDSCDMSSDSASDFEPDEYESDSVLDSAFDMKTAAKLEVSDYYVITVGDLLQRRGRATPSATCLGLLLMMATSLRLLLMAATFLSLPRIFTRCTRQ